VLACWRKAESHRPLFPRTALLPPPLLLLLLLLCQYIRLELGHPRVRESHHEKQLGQMKWSFGG
jgi:hypothetical protein